MIGAAIGAIQLAAGLFSKKKKRPKYEIPGEQQQALTIARQQANMTSRPGDAQARADIDRSTGSAIQNAQRTATSGAQVLNAANTINSQRLMALGQNQAQNEAFRYNANNNLMAALNQTARYRDKQFQINQMEPYMQHQQTRAALIGAGIQNINNSVERDMDRKMMFGKSFLDVFSKGMGG